MRHGGREHRVAADCLAVAGGWNPAIHLASHLGGRPAWDPARAAFLPVAGAVPGMRVAGAAAGDFSTHAALAGGAAMAAAALADLGIATPASELPGCGGRAGAARRVLAGGRGAGAGLARLPERRDGEGRSPGGAGELPLGRAHEALHDARDGDRPGQDLGRRRPRGARRADRARRRRDRARRRSGRPTRRCRSRRSAPAATARASRRSASRRRTARRRGSARRSSRPGTGTGRAGSRRPARPPGSRAATARSAGCAAPSGSAT